MTIIEKIKKHQWGFIKGRKQLAGVIVVDPYIKCLIRANLNRFVVPAHLVISKCDEINNQKFNYVRDVSFVYEK
jgi:GTP-binding protein EngB required for normal cell division